MWGRGWGVRAGGRLERHFSPKLILPQRTVPLAAPRENSANHVSNSYIFVGLWVIATGSTLIILQIKSGKVGTKLWSLGSDSSWYHLVLCQDIHRSFVFAVFCSKEQVIGEGSASGSLGRTRAASYAPAMVFWDALKSCDVAFAVLS